MQVAEGKAQAQEGAEEQADEEDQEPRAWTAPEGRGSAEGERPECAACGLCCFSR
jgi:hypothetical protein